MDVELMNQKIDEAMAAVLDRDPISDVIARVGEKVCAQHCVTFDDLMSDERRGDLWEARADAWRILFAGGVSKSEIARRWGRHPSSVSKTMKKRGGVS